MQNTQRENKYTPEQLETYKRLKDKGMSNATIGNLKLLPQDVLRELNKEFKPSRFYEFNNRSIPGQW
jgi:hypothetical protein